MYKVLEKTLKKEKLYWKILHKKKKMRKSLKKLNDLLLIIELKIILSKFEINI
jgi:hypothetical protein